MIVRTVGGFMAIRHNTTMRHTHRSEQMVNLNIKLYLSDDLYLTTKQKQTI